MKATNYVEVVVKQLAQIQQIMELFAHRTVKKDAFVTKAMWEMSQLDCVFSPKTAKVFKLKHSPDVKKI